ncbi:MAG: site-specific DNA-methyltransferase [Desulfurellales bacterium]|nr:MAG: site-specific DNA-methyltransferase [Desulfurellales bacterium]
MSLITLVNANAEHIPLADNSVQMIATSPPYFGLRDYGVAGQIGLEQTPAQYVARLVTVFRECRRVLREDGLMFVNLGDSYASHGGGAAGKELTYMGEEAKKRMAAKPPPGFKPKDLLGIPWRVAFALQDDGWYLRSDIIWHKPNPMPEPTKDRPTKAHEYVFLLTKSARYFWDAEAVAEKTDRVASAPRMFGASKQEGTMRKDIGNTFVDSGTRNIRSVWTVATQPYSGAHFATWPEKLVEPMVKAGSRPGDLVLDPFAGSGTTLRVAARLGRRAVGLDLSMKYLRENATQRTASVQMEITA